MFDFCTDEHLFLSGGNVSLLIMLWSPSAFDGIKQIRLIPSKTTIIENLLFATLYIFVNIVWFRGHSHEVGDGIATADK
jgi:hypothetical protein